MAVFIPPKGTDEKLSGLTLFEGELVYNTTKQQFYTGDGQTKGGFPIVANQADVPTKLSELENDCGFINDYTEADEIFKAASGQFATKDEIATLISAETDPIFAELSSRFATNLSVNNKVAEEISSLHEVVSEETNAKIQDAVSDIDATYVAKTDLVDELLTKADAKDITDLEVSLSGYAKKDDLDDYVTVAAAANFARNADIPKNAQDIAGDSFTVSGTITDANNVEHPLYSQITKTAIRLKTDGDLGSTELKNTEWQDKVFTVDIGVNNVVSGFCASAFGKGNKAIGAYSFAHGYKTFANNAAAHAEGHNNNANGSYSHAEGQSTVADGSYAHAEGCGVHANGQWSHAEGGEGAEANGSKSHAEGRGKTFGDFSHAEGMYAVASGVCAHAEGNSCQAIGEVSHAEGYSTNVSGVGAHGEGKTTWTGGNYAHAEGEATHADFECSHAEGSYMNTAEAYQHVEGKYGVAASGYQHVVGGGTSESRKNIQTLDWEGNLWNAGNVEAADFIAGDDKLSDKAGKDEAASLADAAEANSISVAQSSYEILMGYIDYLQNQIIALKQTNPETYEVLAPVNDATQDAIITVSSTVTSGEFGSAVANVTAKSIQVKDLEVEGMRMNYVATEDVKISNFESSGTLPKTVSNASTSINTNGYITIKDCTIGQNGYNAIEIGWTTAPSNVTIDNVHFAGKFSNNVITIFDTADDAVINITNCAFDDCSNPIRLSNRSNVKVTLNIVNCEFTQWEGDHAGGTLAYNGMIICQDYTSNTVEEVAEINRFAPEKIKINIINCTHNGEKIMFENQAEVCCTADEVQLLYVYADKGGMVAYEDYCYPQLTVR